jgi:hypothetical protein
MSAVTTLKKSEELILNSSETHACGWFEEEARIFHIQNYGLISAQLFVRSVYTSSAIMTA